MNLYEITSDLLKLQDMLATGEFTEEELADTIEAVEGEMEVKLEGYCRVLRNIEADVEGIKAEEKRLAERRKTMEANIEKLKKAMFDSMKKVGKDKVKGTIFTVAIQKNGGKLPVIDDGQANLDEMPEQLVSITKKADINAIRELLEAGITIKHFALGERGESLRIK